MSLQTPTLTDSTRAASPGFAVFEVVRRLDLEEYGQIHGVTCDDQGNVWFAYGKGGLACVEPANGRVLRHFEDQGAVAGTAFDGTHLWQITKDRIVRIDPQSGETMASIPQPGGHCAGMAWADGALWVGGFDDRRILKIDPETGRVLKTLEADRLVTGVSWIGDELWVGMWKNAEAPYEAELRRVDADSGEVLARLPLADGSRVSGLGADHDRDLLWCGGCAEGGVSAVRRPSSGRGGVGGDDRIRTGE